jgi:predicted metal-dependent hydrolase
VLIRGNEYPIVAQGEPPQIRNAVRPKVVFDGNSITVPSGLNAETLQHAMITLYKEIARAYITERVEYYTRMMKVRPASVRIGGALRRWGSCSSAGRLNFTWRLVMADDAAIDYVVVHELAHMTRMDHSKEFWNIVSGVISDYPAQRAKLRALHHRLVRENWE